MAITNRMVLTGGFCFILTFSTISSENDWFHNLRGIGRQNESPERRSTSSPIRCHSCTSIQASDIIGGAGVHPGIYLTSILLSTIPVTESCRADPFSPIMYENGNADDADNGITELTAPMCDGGLCVKINYTDRYTGNTGGDTSVGEVYQPLRCYSCTTMDADKLLKDVQDPNWKQWLENVRFVPKTPRCNDAFAPDMALRAGVRPRLCDRGVCMKMWFKEREGGPQVWRSCIPNAKGHIRSDCTKITSSEGDMEVCTCVGNLCNGGARLWKTGTWCFLVCSITIIMLFGK